jgi:hypothetical protein
MAGPALTPFAALRDFASGVVVVAHKEDTTELVSALTRDGFKVDEVRGPYTSEQLAYTGSINCLVNHSNAWRIAASRSLPTIIVEADFVPVRGFANLPAPVPPGRETDSLAYLYSVGPEIWDLATPVIARARCASTVAMLIPPKVAAMLLEFFDEQVADDPAGEYRPWDSSLGYWLLARGVQSYLPYRHYGEHGGLGNPEHARFGLGRIHRADALIGRLAFLPVYAQGKRWMLWRGRLRGRIWGILRLVTGRLLRWHDFARARGKRAELLRFAVGRLFVRAPR